MSVRVKVISIKQLYDKQIEQKINEQIIELEKLGARKDKVTTYAIDDMIVIQYTLCRASKIVKAQDNNSILYCNLNESQVEWLIKNGVTVWADFCFKTVQETRDIMSKFNIVERRKIAGEMELRKLGFVASYDYVTNR